MAKIRIEEIRKEAELYGWKLISTEYKNLNTDMEFRCPNNHRIVIPYKKIRDKYECPICKEFNGCTSMTLNENSKDYSRRVLAFDQSSHTSGYAVFDDTTLIHYGHITFRDKLAPVRYSKIKAWMSEMLVKWNPDFVMYEKVQFQEGENTEKSVTTFSVLTELIGVLKTFYYEQEVDYDGASVSTWRHHEHVTGRNRAELKASAQARVKECYDIDVTDDEADAILIGRYATQAHHEIEMIKW